jgi:hypothetical protein
MKLKSLALFQALMLVVLAHAAKAQPLKYHFQDLVDEEAQIDIDLTLAATSLDSSRKDISHGFCPRAEQNLISSYANVELGKIEVPTLRDKVPYVEPNGWGYSTGRRDKLKLALNNHLARADDMEITLDTYRRDVFERQCPDHPALLAFLQGLDATEGTNRIAFLTRIKDRGGNVTPRTIQDALQSAGVAPIPIPSNDRSGNERTTVPSTSIKDIINKLNTNPDDPEAIANLLTQLQSGPNGLSRNHAQQAIDAYKSGDIRKLIALLQADPDNKTLAELLRQALINAGMSKEDADKFVEAVRRGDRRAANEIADQYPGKTQFQVPPSGGPEPGSGSKTPTGPGPGAELVIGRPPPPHTKFVDENGNVIDEHDLEDEQGNLKKRTVRTRYSDHKDGQIESEVVFDLAFQPVEAGVARVAKVEEPNSQVDWLFTITQSNTEKAGAGFTSTFELVNEGKTANAEFKVTAWEGPDGRVQSSDKKFDFKFPKPGDYNIKVYGTTKYNSKFTIPLDGIKF